MDIPSRLFADEVVKIMQSIAESHFVALDLEFTGIPSRRNRGGKGRLSLQEIYADTKEAAKQYQILQVGLTIVEEDAQKGAYTVRPYNFHINPIPAKEDYHRLERIWSFQSGAVSFLLKNKFQFGLPLTEGVPYLSRKEEEQIRTSWALRDAERAAIEDMVLKVDDKPLVDHIHLSVQNWLSQPLVDREDYLNIPHLTPERPRIKHIPSALNRYQIRLTHQTVRKDYSKLKTLGKDGFVQITAKSEKDAEERIRQERRRELDIVNSIEFRWLVEALCGGDISQSPERAFLAAMQSEAKLGKSEAEPVKSEVKLEKDDATYQTFVETLQNKLNTRRRVLFGHNCFIDLVYLYACFLGDLPDRVEDFQELIHGLFPAVVDTKYLASLVKKLRFNSSLEALEKEMQAETLPLIEVPSGFDRYAWGERFHEAGYDSFTTAKVAIKLSAKLEREGKLRELRGPQVIVNAGQTAVLDSDAEDDEQLEEYVTASESVTGADPVVAALPPELAAVSLLDPTASQKNSDDSPLEAEDKAAIIETGGDRNHEQDNKELQVEPATETDIKFLDRGNVTAEPALSTLEAASLASPDHAPGMQVSAADTPVVAVKQEILGERGPSEVKRIKSALAHHNLFDILDVSTEPARGTVKSIGRPEQTKTTDAVDEDLLLWSDTDDEHESMGGASNGEESSAKEGIQTTMTPQELEEKVDKMAAKGEMMPRWDSPSGIWKVIGNKLMVNACEEGVCIL